MSRRSKIPVDHMLKDMPFLSHELLRSSRIRLDCAAILLTRQTLAEAMRKEEQPWLFTFCDASPQ